MVYRARRGSGVLALVTLLAAAAASTAEPATPSFAGSWSGTLRLAGTSSPVGVALIVRGTRATIDLGPGHPNRVEALARPSGGRLRLTVPGRPTPLRIELRRDGRAAVGTVRFGETTGSVRLRTGAAELGVYGTYRLGPTSLGVAPLGGNPFGVVYETGEVRRLHRTGPGAFALSSGLGVRLPASGTARFAREGAAWKGERATRIAARQLEVQFVSRGAVLRGTLTIPPGPGPHPAVALVHGSGPTARSDVGVYAPFFVARGVAVLAYDKRGIGLSGGAYQGDLASASAIDTYARDAEAAVRFLAAQPEVDKARVGLSGVSQAGWIMPLAAARERAVRFLVLVSSPTVTQGESDLYGSLTGQGARAADLADAERRTRASGPSGFDPLPSIRQLTIPALWLFGELDHHVPTALSRERLEPLVGAPGRDFTIEAFARGDHFLVHTSTGRSADVPRSSQFAEGLFTTIADWLAARRLAAG